MGKVKAISQTEAKAIIRDGYNTKHYEIIGLGNGTFIYDYDLRRLVEKEERIEALDIRSPRPSQQA